MGRVCLGVAILMIITFLSPIAYQCSAAVLMKGNTTYRCKDDCLGGGVGLAAISDDSNNSDDISLEFMDMIELSVARMLQYPGQHPKTDGTKNRNRVVCPNGKGNQYGVCDGKSTNKKQCSVYHRTC